jgi:hypothetical protein
MATHGIELGLGRNLSLSHPEALLSFALSLQGDDGLWQGDAGSMTLDGIFQTTRSSVQLGRRDWDLVEDACDRLLATQAPRVNDAGYVLGRSQNSHQLPNIVAAIGECATHFPALVKTRRPWTCCARYV